MIYASFTVESFGTPLFHLKENYARGKKVVISLLFLRDSGSGSQGLLRGKDVTFYFYMFEICVSLQTPNLMSSVSGCRYGGEIELN